MKYYMLNRNDGGVDIMAVPAYAAKTNGVEEFVRYYGGKPCVLREGAWKPIEEITPAPELLFRTPDECMAKWTPARQAENTGEHVVIDVEDLPADRTYRGAWKKEGKSRVVHDMAKARDIHRNMLREKRAPLLATLDMQYMRADEAGDAALKTSIASQKQALRDITTHPDIAAATTVDELKALVPAEMVASAVEAAK